MVCAFAVVGCVQGFTTGTLQNHARKYSVAIDTLSFGFRVTHQMNTTDVTPEDVPTDGVLVYGLFMDGARWDREANMLGTRALPLPVMHVCGLC